MATESKGYSQLSGFLSALLTFLIDLFAKTFCLPIGHGPEGKVHCLIPQVLMDNACYKCTQKTVVLALQVLMELAYLSRGENTATPVQKASTVTWTGWRKRQFENVCLGKRTLLVTLIPSCSTRYMYTW